MTYTVHTVRSGIYIIQGADLLDIKHSMEDEISIRKIPCWVHRFNLLHDKNYNKVVPSIGISKQMSVS